MLRLRTTLLVLASLPLLAHAQAARDSVEVRDAFPNLPAFDRPVDLQAPDDGSNRLFIVEQPGRIFVFDNDEATSSATLFLDITDRVSDFNGNIEAGCLGLTFDPDYARNGYFYVYYTAADPRRVVVSRFSVSAADPNQGDPDSEATLFQVHKPTPIHNAGQMAFGPPEGPGGERYLYVGLGDGGVATNGQRPFTLLGSMLRLDVDGGGLPLDCAAGTGAATVPPDNPGVGSEVACDEMYAYGFRNPWRFSFDRHGRLWLADVGQSALEEVDLVEAGGNYGWDKYEGTRCRQPPCNPEGKRFPIYEHPHLFGPDGGFAIIGGYTYEGPNCAALRDLYVYSDWVTGNVWTLDYDGTTATNEVLIPISGLGPSTFGRDEQGELYLASLSQDRIARFACPQAVTVRAEPVGGPVVIGPDGGAFAFDLTLTNTTSQPQVAYLWADVDLSNGAEVTLSGPQGLNLGAGVTTTRRIEVSAPGSTPPGTSTFTVKVGLAPDEPESSDRFTLTKQPGAAAPRLSTVGTEGWTADWAPGTSAPAAADAATTAAAVEVLPNPFAHEATIRFTLPEAAPVRVEVLDLLGRRVALLADGPAAAGAHAVPWEAAGVPAGVYLVRVAADGETRTYRVTRLR
jgi:hypothetical protein